MRGARPFRIELERTGAGYESTRSVSIPTATMSEDRGRISAVTVAWLWAAYVLGGLFMIYPVPLVWLREVPGPPEDNLQGLWNLWWVKKSLLSGQSPLETNLLYYPQGVDLSLHTFSFFNTLLGIPLQPLLGLVGTYNVLWFLSFPLGAMGAFAIAHRVSRHLGGSILAGWVFAFSAYHMAHGAHHLNLTSLQFLPWYAWALERMREKPGLARGAVAGLFFAGVSLCSWYYAVFMALFTLLWMSFVRREPGLGRAVLVAMGVASAVLWPVLVPMMARVLTEPPEVLYEGAPGRLGGDLLAYLLPGPGHSLVRSWDWLRQFYEQTGPFPWESVVFLGWLPLVLGLYGLLTSPWPRTRLWCVSFGLFWILSLGPVLYFDGVALTGHLPYEWIVERTPGLRMVRVPSRFVVMCTLSLAVLTALGYSRVESLLLRGGAAARRALWATAALILVLETVHVPLETTEPLSVTKAEAFKVLKEDSEPGAVLELPMKGYVFNLVYLFRQTVHERPLLFGILSRVPDESTRWIREGPLLNFFVRTRPVDEAFVEELLRRLREVQVRFVVLNGPFFGAMGEEERGLHRRLVELLDSKAERVTTFEGTDIIVYRIS